MDYGYETNRKKLLKSIIPKSGSYDFKNAQPPLANSNGTIRLKETQIHNNQNANNHIYQKTKNTNTTKSIAMPKKVSKNLPETSKFDLNNSLFDKIFPKYRRSLIGIPLLCLAYFASLYFLVFYLSVSIISVYQLMYGDLTNMYPLFLLVIGYIAITVMSLLLIVAIFKEMLNFVACWIIVVSVFILPEIGLNILLANNSLNWFNTNMGFYTLVFLIVRVCFNLPCVLFILIYHINVTKKNVYLKNLMMPLKDSIINGDVLKIYNSIKIDNFEVPSEMHHSMPVNLNHSATSASMANDASMSHAHNTSNQIKASAVVTFSDRKLDEYNYKPNTYFYRFSPHKNYSIQLKPAQHMPVDDCQETSQTNDLNALHLVWNNNMKTNTNFHARSNTRGSNQMTNFDYLRHLHQASHLHHQHPTQESESNQIFQIPIYAESQHEKCSVKTAYKSVPSSDSFNKTTSSNNNYSKSLGLTNHQIYLPPAPPAYENNYIKIAKSFQI